MHLAHIAKSWAVRSGQDVGVIVAMTLVTVIGTVGLGPAWGRDTAPSAEPIIHAGDSSPQSGEQAAVSTPAVSGFKPANAANLTRQSRADGYSDFIRVLWVSAGVPVTSMSLGKRAFFTASNFMRPPLKVDAFLNLVGNYYRDGRDLVIMRCRPAAEQRQLVSPILATWPNVLPAIASDLGGPGRDCSSPNLSVGEKQICSLAFQYTDFQQDVYVDGLRQATELASQLYATPESTDALRADYGIFPAFTGLGFTVQSSSTNTGSNVPMLTAETLANSAVPEYLLINGKLGDANCRCVQVPEYKRRRTALISPAFVWNHGKLDHGACRRVRRLE